MKYIYLIYNILNILFTPLIVVFYLYRLLKKKETWGSLTRKFSFNLPPKSKEKLVWFNAASVGEFNSILFLLKYLQENTNCNFLITTSTLSSSRLAHEKLPKNVIYTNTPIDIYWVIKKFLDHFNPDFIINIDSEIWPNLILQGSKRAKLLLLNARISNKSCARWEKYPQIFSYLMKNFTAIYTQGKLEQSIYAKFGIEAKYLMNLKLANPSQESSSMPDHILNYQKLLSDKKIILLASTHMGEEKLLLENLSDIATPENISIILVPRHPERAGEIGQVAQALGYSHTLLRDIDQEVSKKCYIVNTVGELKHLYNLARIAIIGGSFLSHLGGHNPIEPSNGTTAILCGKHYSNFSDLYNLYKENKAVEIVDENNMATIVKNLLVDENQQKQLAQNAYKVKQQEESKTLEYFKEIKDLLNCN